MRGSMNAKTRAARGVAGAVLLIALAAPRGVAAQATAPYSVEEVTFLIQGPLPDDRLINLVSDGCLDFEMNAFIARDFRAAGASLDLIDALNEACVIAEEPPEPVAQPTPAAAEPPPTRPATNPPAQTTRVASLTGRGFYGSDSWLRFHYSTIDQTTGGGISWARMTSGIAELGLWGTLERTLDTTTGPSEVEWSDADAGMSLNLFLLQPRTGRPLGLYVGGLASFSRTWLEGGFDEGVNSYRFGWEAGAFGRIGTDGLAFVPRVAVRNAKHRVTDSESPVEPWDVRTVIMGAELKFGAVVPGVFVHIIDDTTLTIIGLTFAY